MEKVGLSIQGEASYEVLGSRKAAVMIYPRPKRADLELKVVQMLLSLLSQQVL